MEIGLLSLLLYAAPLDPRISTRTASPTVAVSGAHTMEPRIGSVRTTLMLEFFDSMASSLIHVRDRMSVWSLRGAFATPITGPFCLAYLRMHIPPFPPSCKQVF